MGIKIKEVVQDYMAEEGRDTPHSFANYIHFAIRGLEDLHFDVDGYTKRTVLTATSAGIVPLPSDFVKEVRIAVCDSNGNLIFLGRNDSIYKPSDSCGNPYSPQVQNTGEFYSSYNTTVSEHISDGQIIGAYYGVGGRSTAGEFRINGQNKRIELTGNLVGENVILDYIARPEQINGEFEVHPFLKEPLMNYIEMASKRRFVSAGQAAALKRTYVISKDWARMRFDGIGEDEALEISRRNFMLAPHY